MDKDKRIGSLKELKNLCNKGYEEFYVLSGGMLRGSRDIYYNKKDKNWYLWYNVSDTEHCYKNDKEFIKEELRQSEQEDKSTFLDEEKLLKTK